MLLYLLFIVVFNINLSQNIFFSSFLFSLHDKIGSDWMNDCGPKQSKSPLVFVPFLLNGILKGKFMLIIESLETRIEVERLKDKFPCSVMGTIRQDSFTLLLLLFLLATYLFFFLFGVSLAWQPRTNFLCFPSFPPSRETECFFLKYQCWIVIFISSLCIT